MSKVSNVLNTVLWTKDQMLCMSKVWKVAQDKDCNAMYVKDVKISSKWSYT